MYKPSFSQKNFFIKVIKLSIVLSFVFTLILLILPFYPEIEYKFATYDKNNFKYKVSDVNLRRLNLPVSFNSIRSTAPPMNRLVIPKIGVDAEILEYGNIDILLQKEGVWREPDTKNPETGGNMVIAGHRFQYLPPNTSTFYNLDKLERNDKVLVYWKSKDYLYEIIDKFEVLPTRIEVKDDDPDHKILTLYTCTPLGSAERRLVVKASEISED